MGLFRTIRLIKEEYKKIKRIAEMTYDDMISLSNEELKEVISNRMFGESRRLDVEECLNHFSGVKRIYYIVDYYDMEVQNGGLCQYFVNSSRITAPYILDALNSIGAINYKDHLYNFVTNHQINLSELDSFIIEDVEEFEKQNQRYPFDDFDKKYYNMYEKDPLEDILIKYVRTNLREFV